MTGPQRVGVDVLLVLRRRLESGERPLDAWRSIAAALGWEPYSRARPDLWLDRERHIRFARPELVYRLDDIAELQRVVLPGWRVQRLVEWPVGHGGVSGVAERFPGGHWECRLQNIQITKMFENEFAFGTARTEHSARLAAMLQALARAEVPS